MRWYFAAKLAIIALLAMGILASNDVFAALVLIDFALVPVIYLIYSFVRKKKLAPGEYRIKPEGKRFF